MLNRVESENSGNVIALICYTFFRSGLGKTVSDQLMHFMLNYSPRSVSEDDGRFAYFGCGDASDFYPFKISFV